MDTNNLQAELLNLRESNRILQDVTRNMVDAIVITDFTGIISYCSESVIQPGCRTNDLVGKNVFELVHLDDVTFARDTFISIIRDESRKQIEFRLRAENGDYYWYDVVGQTLKEEAKIGTMQCIFSGRYIHNRKKAEKALHNSEQKFRLILN